jgi:uncharacterized membrane protein
MWFSLIFFASTVIYPCIIIVFLLYLRQERITLEQCRRATTEESIKMLSTKKNKMPGRFSSSYYITS